MANNRLALVCEECKEGAYLGKYYPSQGWFSTMDVDYKEYLDAFLQKHSHKVSNGGEQDFMIGYENDGGFRWFDDDL